MGKKHKNTTEINTTEINTNAEKCSIPELKGIYEGEINIVRIKSIKQFNVLFDKIGIKYSIPNIELIKILFNSANVLIMINEEKKYIDFCWELRIYLHKEIQEFYKITKIRKFDNFSDYLQEIHGISLSEL